MRRKKKRNGKDAGSFGFEEACDFREASGEDLSRDELEAEASSGFAEGKSVGMEKQEECGRILMASEGRTDLALARASPTSIFVW